METKDKGSIVTVVVALVIFVIILIRATFGGGGSSTSSYDYDKYDRYYERQEIQDFVNSYDGKW
ncbi:MAG: hypothetical protein IKT57_03520 [Clostridia bacterium]|nr:hypothetical protein [Clostridia bacterium]